MKRLHIRSICLVVLSLLCGIAWSQITIRSTNVSCYGEKDGTIDIQVPNATAEVFHWGDIGDYASHREGLAAGTYHVTITDATGCDYVLDHTITAPDAPVSLRITWSRDKSGECEQISPVRVMVIPSGGTAPYKINGRMLDETGTYKETVSASGFRTYTVVDERGCVASKRIRFFVGRNRCAQDPNNIIGPSGFEAPAWVAGIDTLGYTINFENDPQLATAPAQHVFITHTFDGEINPSTFRLGTFGFGEHVFSVPENVSSFQHRYDLTQTQDVLLDVVAGFDVQNNRAVWSLTAIDPLTGLRPTDPLVGFLPVNDSLASGEGFVFFTVRQDVTVETGDTISAQASIVFDQNAAIQTNIWTNVVDAFPPETMLNPLDPVTEDNAIFLSWSGNDDLNGCGIAHYELFVSEDDGPYEFYSLFNPDSLQTVFKGEYDHAYRFYIIGVDHVGNREVKTTFETQTFVLPTWTVEMESLQDVYCVYDTMEIEYGTVLVDAVDIVMTADSGFTFQTIASGIDTSVNPFFWEIPDSLAGKYIKLYTIANDSSSILDSSIFVQVKGLPDVDAGDDIVTCPHDIVHLIPSGANTFFWEPQVAFNVQTDAVQSFRPDSSSVYYVTGTDVSGCINRDSVLITVHPTYLDSTTHLMCNEDSVFVGGGYQTEPGFYVDELISENGCDSTIVTEVILTGPCLFPVPQAYVDKDATGLNNGTSWVNAFTDLQDALTAVEYYPNLREIWVAEGIYYPDIANRDSSFVLSDSVSIYGGFIGVENTRQERSTNASLVQISGDIGVLNDSTDNAFHVFKADSTCTDCIVDGMTILFGQADSAPNASSIGAGLYNEGKLTLSNCIIERNTSILEGAAIYNVGTFADLLITNCIFRLNTSAIERDIVNDAGAELRFGGLNQILD